MPLSLINLSLLPRRKHHYHLSVQLSGIFLYVYMDICVHIEIKGGGLCVCINSFLTKMDHIVYAILQIPFFFFTY